MKIQFPSLYLLFGFLFIGQILIGQKEDASTKNILKNKRGFKNDLSIDFKNIGLNSIFNGTSLFYKRNYQKGKLIDVNLIRSYRFGLSLNIQDNLNGRHYESNNSGSITDYSKYKLVAQNKYNVNLILGLQKQYQHKAIVLFKGIDAQLSYLYYDDDYTNAIFNDVSFDYAETTDYKISVYRLGLNPFIGLKYYYYGNLYAALETGIYFGYFYSKANHFEDPDPVKSNGFQVEFNNIRFIQLGYVF